MMRAGPGWSVLARDSHHGAASVVPPSFVYWIDEAT